VNRDKTFPRPFTISSAPHGTWKPSEVFRSVTMRSATARAASILRRLHLLRMGGLPLLTYYTYVIHLAVAVPMLVVEVPFGKWAHLLYRPLAMYLTAVKEKAREASTNLVGAREATM